MKLVKDREMMKKEKEIEVALKNYRRQCLMVVMMPISSFAYQRHEPLSLSASVLLRAKPQPLNN